MVKGCPSEQKISHTATIARAWNVARVAAGDLARVEGVAAGAGRPGLEAGKLEALARAAGQALLDGHGGVGGGAAGEEGLALGFGSASNGLPAVDAGLEPANLVDRLRGSRRAAAGDGRGGAGASDDGVAARKLLKPCGTSVLVRMAEDGESYSHRTPLRHGGERRSRSSLPRSECGEHRRTRPDRWRRCTET